MFILLIPICLFAASDARAQTSSPVLGKSDPLVRELLARRHWSRAARMIDAKSDEAQLVKGYALLKAGRDGQALEVLEGLDDLSPALLDFLLLQRAKAHLSIGAPELALSALDGIQSPNSLGRMWPRIKARALREAGKSAEAEGAYARLLKTSKSEAANALLGLARVEIERESSSDALQYLKRLDIEYPASRQASIGRTLAQTLIGKNASLKASWGDRTASQSLARGEALLKAHQNKRALAALMPLTRAFKESAELCRHRYALGRSLRKLRKWDRARPYLEEAVQVCTSVKHELAPWARHLAAKAANVRGDDALSAEHYKTQLVAHPAHRLADDAVYHFIRHLVDDKEDVAGAERFITEHVPRFPAGDMMSDAVFYVAINAFRRRQFKRAHRVLALQEKLTPPSQHDGQLGRITYWRGRIAHALGRRSEGRRHYRRALTEYPLSWYSIMAYSRLREESAGRANRWLKADLEKMRATKLSFLSAANDESDPRWTLATDLARLGLAGPAWSVLRQSELKVPAMLWGAARLLDQAGAYPLSHNILRRRLEHFRASTPLKPNRAAWEVAFPRPFTRLIDRKSASAKIPSNLARAIMREESGFNAGVESSANAIGLMQLILPTARDMAKGTGRTATPKSLRDPDFNVTLGTKYLARVRSAANAALPLIPAGYNAGAGRLKQWIRKRGHLPLDLFVELIPYEEARGYTKRVMSTYGTYEFLYGDSKRPPYFAQATRNKTIKKRRKGRRGSSRKRRRGTRR